MSTLPRNVKVNLTSGTHPAPEGCTATVPVGGETLTCERTDPGHYPVSHHSAWVPPGGGFITWTDSADGASPHHDPKPPRYRAVPGADGDWGVEAFTDTDAWLIAEFSGGHPDPEGAVEAEVARLSGGDTVSNDVVRQLGKALRERDEAREDRDRFKAQRNEAQDAHHQLAEALEKIASIDGPVSAWRLGGQTEVSVAMRRIARAALEGWA